MMNNFFEYFFKLIKNILDVWSAFTFYAIAGIVLVVYGSIVFLIRDAVYYTFAIFKGAFFEYWYIEFKNRLLPFIIEHWFLKGFGPIITYYYIIGCLVFMLTILIILTNFKRDHLRVISILIVRLYNKYPIIKTGVKRTDFRKALIFYFKNAKNRERVSYKNVGVLLSNIGLVPYAIYSFFEYIFYTMLYKEAPTKKSEKILFYTGNNMLERFDQFKPFTSHRWTLFTINFNMLFGPQNTSYLLILEGILLELLFFIKHLVRQMVMIKGQFSYIPYYRHSQYFDWYYPSFQLLSEVIMPKMNMVTIKIAVVKAFFGIPVNALFMIAKPCLLASHNYIVSGMYSWNKRIYMGVVGTRKEKLFGLSGGTFVIIMINAFGSSEAGLFFYILAMFLVTQYMLAGVIKKISLAIIIWISNEIRNLDDSLSKTTDIFAIMEMTTDIKNKYRSRMAIFHYMSIDKRIKKF